MDENIQNVFFHFGRSYYTGWGLSCGSGSAQLRAGSEFRKLWAIFDAQSANMDFHHVCNRYCAAYRLFSYQKVDLERTLHQGLAALQFLPVERERLSDLHVCCDGGRTAVRLPVEASIREDDIPRHGGLH
ncbi:hypothetical protein D3C72_1982560 [compost metagenome]